MSKTRFQPATDITGISQRLLEIAKTAQLCKTPAGGTYTTVPVRNHNENYPVQSAEFRAWLMSRYFKEFHNIPTERAVNEVQDLLEASARLSEDDPIAIHTRVALSAGSICLDLGDEDWNVVKVTAEGWNVEAPSAIRFRRPRNMAALPAPSHVGNINLLRPFVNLPNEDDWVLFVSWLVAVLRAKGPYPILVLFGEQGSAKSTLSRVIKALLDPVNDGPIRSLPRNEHDLAIAMHNSAVLVYDNVSSLSHRWSDSFCRVSTGSGFSTRQLYTDDGEVIFGGARPLCLNGIEEFAERADLLSRAVVLHLPAIPDSARRDEDGFWKDFERVRPLVLGALLDAASMGLRNYESTRLERMPRMADFAKWVTACEPALPWPAGKFMEAYTANRDEAIEVGLDSSPVAPGVRRLAAERKTWMGTATDLLGLLNRQCHMDERAHSTWPKTAKDLSNRLRRDAPNLKKVGVELTFDIRSGKRGERLLAINLVDSANQSD